MKWSDRALTEVLGNLRVPEKPFLRGSERGDWKRCPWAWNLKYNYGLSRRRSPTWAVFGTAYHAGMEVWYGAGTKRGKLSDVVDRFVEVLGEQRRQIGVRESEGEDATLVSAKEIGIAMLQGYAQEYGKEPDIHVIHSEYPLAVDIEGKVIYLMRLDRIVAVRRDRSWRVMLWDEKTCAALPEVEYLELDDQAGSYLGFATTALREEGILKAQQQLEGIVFNYARKAIPTDKPRNVFGQVLNKDGEVSKRQPAKLYLRHTSYRSAEQTRSQAKRVLDEAHMMGLQRRGRLPIIKNTRYDCPRQCEFFRLCASHEEGDSAWAVFLSDYEKRDPYSGYEEFTE